MDLENKIKIRYPKLSDAENLVRWFNSLIEENVQFTSNKKVTLEDEKRWIRNALRKIKEKRAIYLVAEVNNTIAGVIDLKRYSGRSSHIAELAIAVAKEYRGKGVAPKLFEELCKRAKKLWKNEVKYILLYVFETNKRAIRFYEKLGFRKVAKIPKLVEWKGKLIAKYVMMRKL